MKKTIILIHEIYGITENLLNLQKKLMNKNYNVILPCLYEDNYSGNDEQESYKKFYSEAGIEKGFGIIDNIINANINSEIYLAGFSVGATIAWLFSADKRVNAVVGIYGSRIREYLYIEPAVQSYLFFCNENSFDIMPMIDKLKEKEKVRVKVINGEHGFYNFPDVKNEKIINEIEEEIFKIIEQDN